MVMNVIFCGFFMFLCLLCFGDSDYQYLQNQDNTKLLKLKDGCWEKNAIIDHKFKICSVARKLSLAFHVCGGVLIQVPRHSEFT